MCIRDSLHAGRAQHPRGGDTAPVHDAAGGDDRQPDMLGQQRHQGQDTDQTLFGMADEGSPVPARFGACLLYTSRPAVAIRPARSDSRPGRTPPSPPNTPPGPPPATRKISNRQALRAKPPQVSDQVKPNLSDRDPLGAKVLHNKTPPRRRRVFPADPVNI